VLVQARVAESNLEKLPVEMLSDRNLTAFINRVGSESERMLSKLRNGEKLSKEDKEQLEKLYQTSHAVRAELSEYVSNMNEKDMMQFMKKGEGVIRDVLDRIENATLPEKGDVKEGIDSEIAQNNPVKNTEKIGTAKAEELCKTYFSDYGMDSFQCIGETVGENYARYNVQGHDKEGTMLFAEIDERTGALVGFNYYKECNERRFDNENAVDLAEEFLEKLGYEDMTAVRIRENGTDADITFVYEEDDVFVYPDSVKVKVCLSRGIVSGMDATSYIKNHRKRDLEKAKISLFTAREKLNENLDVLGARTAVVNTVKGEKMAYEFLCSYGEEKYVVYVNAQTGDEISIVNLKNIK
jgi:germination protein YpeB